MENWLIIAPLLIPLLVGASALVRRRELRRQATLFGLSLNLVMCLALLVRTGTDGMQVAQMGAHPAPFGITLAVDLLGAIMLSIAALIALCCAVFAVATIDVNRERFAFFPLLGFLMLGVNFAFVTGDLFTLYVAFEVMLMASFVILTLGGERGQIEGGLKYVTLNLLSSTVFLVAAGLTYAVAGTLNIAHLSARLAQIPSPGITTLLAVLFLVAFGIKGAIFPFFFWLPASYHTPPVAVTALFGGLLTKVGIYSMWRVLVLVFPNDITFLQPIILTLAALTMLTGVFGAIAQIDVRRLLSFHIISQIGYLLMGLGLFTLDAMAGAVVFMVHVILVKTALFLVSGIAHQLYGTYDLKKLGGMAREHPGIAVVFVLAAFSLAGTPPLSGFWAKYMLIRAGLEAGQYAIVAVALGTSIFTLYSMVKIWLEAFWKPDHTAERPLRTPHSMRLMLGMATVLVVLAVLVGVFIEPTYAAAQNAVSGIMERTSYIERVIPNLEDVERSLRGEWF
jgi:multicomponent Na+:H+ antiporter subunit D